MGKTVVKITRGFDDAQINHFTTPKLAGIVTSKKIGLPLVDIYFINPTVYGYFKKQKGFAPEFKEELSEAVKRLLNKYGSMTLRTCFKFVGLENPRGLLSWRNLKTEEAVLKSVKAAYEHGEAVAKENKITQFELGLILMARVSAQKGGIVVVDIEKERLCSIDVCWGDARLIAMGEGAWDTYWLDENLRLLEKRIKTKKVGYFFRGNERKMLNVFGEKQAKPCLTDTEAKKIARYAFWAANYYQKNVEIEFMINKDGIVDMYELQLKPGIKIAGKIAQDENGGVLLRGLPACPGKVEGKVRIIRGRKDLEKIRVGEIAVLSYPKTDFSLPIFTKALGVVTDFGGATSHFATMARDFNIPCIVGMEEATELLKNGMIILMDADRGKIWRR